RPQNVVVPGWVARFCAGTSPSLDVGDCNRTWWSDERSGTSVHIHSRKDDPRTPTVNSCSHSRLQVGQLRGERVWRFLWRSRAQPCPFVPKITPQKGSNLLILQCRRRDSNPHASRRHPLKMVCLPVPPLRRG